MTNDIESPETRPFSLRGLPWLLGTGALVVYLFSLNHWASMLNLAAVARLSGWAWQPEIVNPAYYLLTLPVYAFPENWVPVGLNLISALCAALALVQLARCVALLPHDRTHEQREREISDGSVFTGKLSWVPPVLAVFACGLQLTFWEHATNGTSEMLDLLMFAFVVRSLLEYRYHGRERWLSRAALVMGAAMSSNVAMVGFFPLFLTALIWIRGISFFNARFLMRTMIMGLLGLSLYLLLPLISAIKSPELAGFWAALKLNVLTQKQTLTQPLLRKPLVLLSLTSLLPVFVISIRWASYFGDTSQVGQRFATALFHGIHAFFLGAFIWVALDPPFGPRNAGYGLAFLPFYFLGALGLGYCSGYFLLVFGPVVERHMRRPPTPIIDLLHRVSTVAVLLVLILTPVALVVRNHAEIRTTNGPLFRDYATSLTEGLPDKAILMTDDFARQFTVQAWVATAKRQKDIMVVNSEWLKWDTYHQYLHQRHGNFWPAPQKVEGKALYSPPMLIAMLLQTCKSNQVFYLHPSFGYYFEIFNLEPAGLLYGLKPFSAGKLLPAPLTEEQIARNEAFFSTQADTILKPILAATDPQLGPNQYVGTGPMRKIRLRRHKNATAIELGRHYSRALNTWAVELQKAGKLEPAAKWFELAIRLNRENVVAAKNLEFNQKLRKGEVPVVELPTSVEDQFGAGRSWDQVLTANGPYDEPGFCLLQADLYLQNSLYRQAAEYFDRVRSFSPIDVESRKWLAQIYTMAGQPDDALVLMGEIRAHVGSVPLDLTNRIDLLSVETEALFAKQEQAKAIALIESTLAADPHNDRMLTAATALYNRHKQFTNSLTVVDRMLAINAGNVSALLNKGYICNQLGKYDEAISSLNKLLTVETNNPYGLLYRGMAYLQSDQLSQAKADYEALLRTYPTAFQPYYDLAEIAMRQGDTNVAIRYAETFLNSSQTNTAEYQVMTERLRSLKGEKPK